MRIIKGIMSIVAWPVTVFFQLAFGIVTAIVIFDDSYANVIAMWATMTFAVFVIGVANILFRTSFTPKKFLARLGLTGLGTFIFSFIFYQFDFHYGWDYFIESLFPFLAPITGIIGFYTLDFFKRNAAIGKTTHQIGNIVSVFVLVAGIYTIWELLTPFRLPLQRISPGQSFNVELVKQVGGTITSSHEKPLVVRDNLVFLGLGPRLSVLDISNPADITLIGQSDLIPGEIGELVLVGDYLYIAPGLYSGDEGNLHIVNISDPTHPKYIGMYSPSGKQVSNVYVFNNLLFITGKNEGSDFISPSDELFILDITNPILPKELGRYSFKENISDIAVSGTYAYIALNTSGHAEAGLRILDFSDPQVLKEINLLYPGSAGGRLIINNHTLYHFGTPDGGQFNLYILDITKPRAPKEITVIDNIGYPDQMYHSGNLIYMGTSIMDFTNPYEPKKVGTNVFDGDLISILEKFAFVVNGDGLVIYDLTDPDIPAKFGEYIDLIPDDWAEIYLDGTKGVLRMLDRLYLMDFSDPASPIIMNRYVPNDLRTVVKTQDNYVFVDGFAQQAYEAIDISILENPMVVWQSAKWNNYKKPFLLLVEGKYAYMINSEDGLYVYDISNPAEPSFISQQADLKSLAEGFDDYAVAGNYMYILDGREIQILDISDKTKISEVGRYDFPADGSGYRKITIIENLAFLDNSLYDGNQPAQLVILDLTNPTRPKRVALYNWGEYSALDGKSLKAVFITDYSGLHVVDFSNPKRPKEVGYYGLVQWSCGYNCMALGASNTAFVFGYPNGLYILRFIPPSE